MTTSRAAALDKLPARVLLDGVNVADDCVECDDSLGYAVLMKRNAAGRHYVDSSGTVAKEVRHGHVVFIPDEAVQRSA